MKRQAWLAVRWVRVGWLVFGGLFVWAVAGYATETETAGRWLYLKYCSACHGSDGKGDGVASGYLRPKPIDLRLIAKNAGGEFPFVPTMQAIDGTKTVRAHGDANMPVWGELLRSEPSDPMAHRVEVQGKLMLITDYLRSIQQK